jgi:hypothetical protein
MKANAYLDKVDSKTKKELQENHKKLHRERRERRLKRHTAKIRQLLDNGGTREEVEALLDLISFESGDELPIPNQIDESSTSSE